MFKIQTLNKIATIGLQQFPQDLYEIGSDIKNPDAILLRSHNLHNTYIPESVSVIGRAGVGVNNIPVEQLTKRGIPVFNTPGANANAVRELVLAGMLLASRHICQAWAYVNQVQRSDSHSSSEALDKEIEQNKKQFVGSELLGKTLGVIGLGSVGVKVANAAIHLGMRVIGYDPTISVHRAWELSASVEAARSIEEILAQADYVSFHVPLLEETKHMINHARIEKMKNGLVLLNFARAGIIDHKALAEALNSKKIRTFVSDFPHPELKDHPHVICLPHLGASTQEAEENCAVMIAKQLRNFFEIGSVTNSPNFPAVEVAQHTHGVRLAIVNENVPNMVAQISAALAAEGLNISSLLNKSRDKIAYTLVDIPTDVSEDALKKISEINGIIQLRKLPMINNEEEEIKLARKALRDVAV